MRCRGGYAVLIDWVLELEVGGEEQLVEFLGEDTHVLFEVL